MAFSEENSMMGTEGSQFKPRSPVVEAMQKRPVFKVDLTWQGLTAWVKRKSVSLWPSNEPYRRQPILKNVSGMARAGTLTAILGPSGAGKTTLLCTLANRFNGEIRGDIRINGWPVDGDMLRLSTFIPQQNLFIETLTAREHLEFVVGLRFPSYSTEERRLRVNELLKELGLEPDSRISSLSGGEKKRLIFASEIVTDPPLLFCDEPTSGLDSHTAHTIISLLEQLAARGRTIICSIHQPSSKVFSSFNHLILLCDGRVAFAGKSQEAQPFFLSLGYRCPQNYNPADFYMQILSGRRGTALMEEKESRGSATKRIHDICDWFAKSDLARRLKRQSEKFNDMTFLSSYSTQVGDRLTQTTMFDAGWRTQVCWLTWRSFLDSIRNPSVHLIRSVHKVMTSILIALCFAGVELNQTGIQAITGALFIFLTENNFPSCYAVLNIPGFIIEPFLFVVIAYWFIGLRPDFQAFLMTTLVLIMIANVACAYGCFLSAAFESIETSTLVMLPINQIIMVSSGFYFNIKTLPAYLEWIKYFSWMMYGNEALTVVQWEGINSIDCEGSKSVNMSRPCVRDGEEVIRNLGFDTNNLTWDITAIALMFCGLHFLGFICIWHRGRSVRRKHAVLRTRKVHECMRRKSGILRHRFL